MRINFLCMYLAILIVGSAISVAAQDDPRTIPTPLYPSYQNNAIVATTDQANSESQMQKSTLAHQNSADEMLKRVAQQTSPAHEFGWNWAATLCTILLIGVIVTPFIFERRPLETRADRGELRRVA